MCYSGYSKGSYCPKCGHPDDFKNYWVEPPPKILSIEEVEMFITYHSDGSMSVISGESSHGNGVHHLICEKCGWDGLYKNVLTKEIAMKTFRKEKLNKIKSYEN